MLLTLYVLIRAGRADSSMISIFIYFLMRQELTIGRGLWCARTLLGRLRPEFELPVGVPSSAEKMFGNASRGEPPARFLTPLSGETLLAVPWVILRINRSFVGWRSGVENPQTTGIGTRVLSFSFNWVFETRFTVVADRRPLEYPGSRFIQEIYRPLPAMSGRVV